MKATRSAESLSLLWPLTYDDTIELDGPEGSHLWTVARGSYGWKLQRRDGMVLITHPTIHDLDGMADFIGAILEYAKGYS